MHTSDFDFDLPDDRIAQYPLPKGTSRLLVVDPLQEDRDKGIEDLPGLLRPNDLLVLNNTKVLPARLYARREISGGRLEILLVDEHSPTRWEALVRPGRLAQPGNRFRLPDDSTVEILEKGEAGKTTLEFSKPIFDRLDKLGHIPLPPYIQRPDRESDRVDYQTVYAREPGAIAAPTAGLHFSDQLLSRLRSHGIQIAELTLHVGIGTFRPVQVDRIEDHKMDLERFELPGETVAAIAAAHGRGGRVVAVGTTVVRALESAALEQGDQLRACRAETDLFITPGFEFSVVDMLLTNFHLPRSTLLMLVCAFAGQDRILSAYRSAVQMGYRFYSFGDAMLVTRKP
jgi:S-adenosylmethionine:tRNA ribosyltransferase-isomerase